MSKAGIFCSSEEFANADFRADGYNVARIRILQATVGTNQDDTLQGSAVDDYLDGGQGNDTLIGRQGNDMLTGGIGHDALAGRSGDDELSGGAGDDTLRGGAGNDILAGNAGQNILFGGGGDDIFRLSSDGLATIRGYAAGERIELGVGLQQDNLTLSQVNRDVVIAHEESVIAIVTRTRIESLDNAIVT